MSGVGEIGRILAGLPAIVSRSVAVLEQLEAMTREGLTISEDTIATMGVAESRWRTLAHWIIAAAFIGIFLAILHLR
jgi:ubiquinone biosynthesis protein